MGFFSRLRRSVKQTVQALADPKTLGTLAVMYASGGIATSMLGGSTFSAALTSVGKASFWTAAAGQSAVFLGLGAVAQALGPDPDNVGGRSIQDLGAQGSRFQFRSPTGVREVIYGETRKSGVIAWIGSTSSTGAESGNEFLHMVICISGAKSDSAAAVYLNDTEIKTNLNASAGFVAADTGTTPDFSAKVSLQWKDGSYPQTSLTENSGINTNPAGWQSSYRLDGISYLYIRMQYDATLFESGIPNISVRCKGKPVYDPRTASTGFSSNPALCIRDYLLDSDYGIGCHPNEIDEDSFQTAANVCDENSNQYQLNGVVDTSKSPASILTDMLTSCSGTLSYSNGKFRLKAAKFIAPTITITEDHLLNAIDVQATNSMRDQFNVVKAIYYNISLDQVTDMPVEDELDLLFLDNGQSNSVDLSLPFTTSEAKARKLAELALFRARNQMTVNALVNLKKFDIQIGDNVNFTYPRLGFTNKIFEVISWSFAFSGRELGISLTMKENSSASYSGGTALTQQIRRVTKNAIEYLDVSTQFSANSEYAASSAKVLIIEKGAEIYGRRAASGVTAKPALEIPSGMGGTLTIKNYGAVFGASGEFHGAHASHNGGNAIEIDSSVSSNVTIINYGTIAAGGGAGGIGARSAFATYFPDAFASTNVGGFGPVDGGDGAGWDGSEVIQPLSTKNLGAAAISYTGSAITSHFGNAITVGSSGAGSNGGGFGAAGGPGQDGGDSTNESNQNMTPPLPIRQGFLVSNESADEQGGIGGNSIVNGTDGEVLNRGTIHGSIT
jgi:hypothetical protein